MIDDLVSLFDETAETHHEEFKKTDGEDPDWAMWYADHLIKTGALAHLVSGDIDREVLIKALLAVNNDFLKEKPETSWQEYFAEKNIIDFL